MAQRIFEEYQKRNPNSALMLVGDGALQEKTENMAKDMGISQKVLFVGAVDNVGDYLCAMDVFLFPSLFEGLGIALIEAQAVGLPCVASASIPTECLINSNCFTLALDVPLSEWCEAIDVCERVGEPHVRLLEYDNRKTARVLEEIYCEYR